MSYKIRPITVAQAFDAPVFAALCEEYRREAARHPYPLGAPPCREIYECLSEGGMLHPLGVFAGDELVGFCTVLITTTAHFSGQVVASTETLFISAAHRQGGVGRRLLRKAESIAAKAGAAGLLVSAPVGGSLACLLPRLGFHETNRIFFRSLSKD